MRFRRLPWDPARILVTSMSGDWLIAEEQDFTRLVNHEISTEEAFFTDCQARHLIARDTYRSTLAPLLSQYRTRKEYLTAGPSLHIFVVSLRCHHTCSYCQVSRRPVGDSAFDLGNEHAAQAVERLFEWPSRNLTVEFQGGEPLLHFDRVRSLTQAIVERNHSENRSIQFVIASTLHDLTNEQLAFMREHQFALSTSLDGPEWLHNANRPRPERDSYRRTLEGIERGRRALGDDAVSALTTLTRRSLLAPDAIVDEYVKQGFHSISLRPLSPYGFARATNLRTGYGMEDFLQFYQVALDRIIGVNRSGYDLEETYGRMVMSQLLTPFAHGYVDLRSPTGAGLGAVVYDFDGRVYPSDEARMLASMGDDSFVMGHVGQPVNEWLDSPLMATLLDAGVAEALTGCSDCAFVPLCGADPIDHYARQGDTIGHRPTSDFCRRQTGMFDTYLKRWEDGSTFEQGLLENWGLRRPTTLGEEMAA